MKKFSIFLIAALCLGLASCEDKWTEATPQTNPQEPIMSADGVTLADALTDALSLNEYKEAQNSIPVLTVSEVKDLPEGSDLKFVMQLSKSENFATSQKVDVAFDGKTATVTSDDWETAHLAELGRSPKAKDTYIRFEVYVVKGSSEARLGDPDKYFAAKKLSVTPYPSTLIIEEAYYLLSPNEDLIVAEAIKFNHTGDIYDNPIFTIKVDISKEQAATGWWWKIVPESTYKTGNWVNAPYSQYGVAENGSEEMAGKLLAKTADFEPGAGCLKTGGQLLLTINIEAGTYEFTSAVDFLYTPGNSNDWNQGASQMLRTTNYAEYEGYAHLNGSFKFTNAPDWDHLNYGSTGDAGKLTTDPSAGNIEAATDGLYYCTVNTSALTYSIAAITTFGLIGDATEGGWDASTALQPSADFLIWTGTAKLKGSGEFKFRANNGWDINVGGSLSDLTQGGSNIATPGEGTYSVTLDFSKLPYTATLVKQ